MLQSKAMVMLIAAYPRLEARSLLQDELTILIMVLYYEEVSSSIYFYATR